MSDDWGDLTQDQSNANLGTEVGAQALEKSIKDNKAGRGVVLAADNSVIGGNKTVLEAERQGLKLQIIDTKGDTIIANRRTDIPSADSPEGKALAIADNRVAEQNLNWDMAEVAAAMQEGVDLTGLWDDAALDAMLPDLSKMGDVFGDNGAGDDDPIGEVQPGDDGETVVAGAPVREGKTRDEREYKFEFRFPFDDSLIVKRALDEAKLAGLDGNAFILYLCAVFVGHDQETKERIFADLYSEEESSA